VWLRVRHRTPASLPVAITGKLRPRFYRPYRVEAVINNIVVWLTLPPRARLHNVFQVSLLKKFVKTPSDVPPPLPAMHYGAAVPEPKGVVCTHLSHGVR
jgi:hypothetical protein